MKRELVVLPYKDHEIDFLKENQLYAINDKVSIEDVNTLDDETEDIVKCCEGDGSTVIEIAQYRRQLIINLQ